MRAWISIYLKGCFMGAADMIPGVSGGTIALIVGIYERLVTAIAAIDPRVLSHLRHVNDPAERATLRNRLRAMDLGFLLVLGLGIGTAVLVLSRVILQTLQAYPAEVNAFFFGLIGASAILIYRDVTLDTWGRVAVVIVGFVLAFTLSGVATTGTGSANLVVVFATGAVAISAMVLPGISGAAILYILGQYEFMLDTLRSFTDGALALVSGTADSETVNATVVVAVFMLGAILGLLTTARVVAWALDRFRVATLAFLVALMVGALRLPLEEMFAAVGIPGALQSVSIGLAGLLGVIAVLGLDWATETLSYT